MKSLSNKSSLTILVLLTSSSYLIFDGQLLGTFFIFPVLATAVIKTFIIQNNFMEIKFVSGHWQWLYKTWTIGVAILIVIGHFAPTLNKL